MSICKVRDISQLSMQIILTSKTFDLCLQNVKDIIQILKELGATIHPGKFIIIPSQKILFLGFILSSTDITIILENEKKEKLGNLLLEIKKNCICKIFFTQLTRVIENMVASFPACNIWTSRNVMTET